MVSRSKRLDGVELFPWVAGVDMVMGYSQSGVHHVWRRLSYGLKKILMLAMNCNESMPWALGAHRMIR